MRGQTIIHARPAFGFVEIATLERLQCDMMISEAINESVEPGGGTGFISLSTRCFNWRSGVLGRRGVVVVAVVVSLVVVVSVEEEDKVAENDECEGEGC